MIGVIVYALGMVCVISIAYFERKFLDDRMTLDRHPECQIQESFRDL